MADGTPPAEVLIDIALVQTLLAEQAPAIASLPVVPFGEGWDNALFRIGDRWLMRLPRRAAAVPLLENEHRVLSHLAASLSVFVPAPVFFGAPSAHFPWPWSICQFVEGVTLDQSPLNRQGVMQWIDFLVELHRPVDHAFDPIPPHNPHRGVPLEHRRNGLEQRIVQLNGFGVEVDHQLLACWEQSLIVPVSRHPVWIHGDPHPRNLLGRSGQLTAVLDWGDVTAGDPASDLASLWMVAHAQEDRLDGLKRYRERQRAGLNERELGELIKRSMGWALVYGCTHLAAGLVDHPAHAVIGERTLINLRHDLRVS